MPSFQSPSHHSQKPIGKKNPSSTSHLKKGSSVLRIHGMLAESPWEHPFQSSQQASSSGSSSEGKRKMEAAPLREWKSSNAYVQPGTSSRIGPVNLVSSVEDSSNSARNSNGTLATTGGDKNWKRGFQKSQSATTNTTATASHPSQNKKEKRHLKRFLESSQHHQQRDGATTKSRNIPAASSTSRKMRKPTRRKRKKQHLSRRQQNHHHSSASMSMKKPSKTTLDLEQDWQEDSNGSQLAVVTNGLTHSRHNNNSGQQSLSSSLSRNHAQSRNNTSPRSNTTNHLKKPKSPFNNGNGSLCHIASSDASMRHGNGPVREHYLCFECSEGFETQEQLENHVCSSANVASTLRSQQAHSDSSRYNGAPRVRAEYLSSSGRGKHNARSLGSNQSPFTRGMYQHKTPTPDPPGTKNSSPMIFRKKKSSSFFSSGNHHYADSGSPREEFDNISLSSPRLAALREDSSQSPGSRRVSSASSATSHSSSTQRLSIVLRTPTVKSSNNTEQKSHQSPRTSRKRIPSPKQSSARTVVSHPVSSRTEYLKKLDVFKSNNSIYRTIDENEETDPFYQYHQRRMRKNMERAQRSLLLGGGRSRSPQTHHHHLASPNSGIRRNARRGRKSPQKRGKSHPSHRHTAHMEGDDHVTNLSANGRESTVSRRAASSPHASRFVSSDETLVSAEPSTSRVGTISTTGEASESKPSRVPQSDTSISISTKKENEISTSPEKSPERYATLLRERQRKEEYLNSINQKIQMRNKSIARKETNPIRAQKIAFQKLRVMDEALNHKMQMIEEAYDELLKREQHLKEKEHEQQPEQESSPKDRLKQLSLPKHSRQIRTKPPSLDIFVRKKVGNVQHKSSVKLTQLTLGEDVELDGNGGISPSSPLRHSFREGRLARKEKAEASKRKHTHSIEDSIHSARSLVSLQSTSQEDRPLLSGRSTDIGEFEYIPPDSQAEEALTLDVAAVGTT